MFSPLPSQISISCDWEISAPQLCEFVSKNSHGSVALQQNMRANTLNRKPAPWLSVSTLFIQCSRVQKTWVLDLWRINSSHWPSVSSTVEKVSLSQGGETQINDIINVTEFCVLKFWINWKLYGFMSYSFKLFSLQCHPPVR